MQRERPTWNGPRLLAAVAALSLVIGGCGNAAKKDFDDSRANSYYQLGLRYFEEGQQRPALKEIERAVELDPKNAVYRNSYGLVYFSLGEYALSEAQFKRALRLDPSYTDIHANLGMVYSEMERYDLAVKEYAIAMADPGYLTPERVYINWGLTLEKQNDMVGAQAKLREAVATNRRYPRAHYELARFLEDHGDEPGALEEYLQAWAGMSEVPVLNLKIGEIFLNRGDDGQARRYLEKVIAVAPDSPEASQARTHLERLSSG